MTFGGSLGRERRGHVAIELDGRQVRDLWRQPQGQRARARPDLEKAIGRLRLDRLHQPVGPRGLEEMLSEPLLRPDARPAAHHTSSSDSPRQYFSSISSISLLAHAEVVAELVDDRLGDAVADLVVVLARLLDRNLVDRDAIGKRVAIAPAALGSGVP